MGQERRNWLLIGQVVSALGLGVLLLGQVLIFQHVVNTERGVYQSYQVELAIERLVQALTTAETTHRRYLLTGDADALDLRLTAMTQARERADMLPQLVAGSEPQRIRAERLRELIDLRLQLLDHVLGLHQDGRFMEARRIIITEAAPIMMSVRRLADEMVDEEEIQLMARSADIKALHRWFMTASVVLGTVLAAVLVSLLQLARRARSRDRLVNHELRQALEDRSQLLREINHRVGNSLMLVASLLRMQRLKATDPATADELEKAHNRVHAVGEVHKYLQGLSTISTLDVAPYLHSLCEQLSQSLTGGPGNIRVTADRAELPVEQVPPIGLIVTELVTNAVRYGDQSGTLARAVQVRLRHRGDGSAVGCLELSVCDSGNGLPHGFNPAATPGMGFVIVQALVGQLAGTMRIGTPQDQESGAEIRIQIPPAPIF